MIEARRHDALNGVAFTVRNSQLDKSASALAAELLTVTRERYLAKEWVGSNRLEKIDCNFP
jgi:hypothetical protein